MGKKIVIMCDKGFDIGYDYHSDGDTPFHFHRLFSRQPVICPMNTHRLGVDEVCCHTGCCNCDHLNLEPLED